MGYDNNSDNIIVNLNTDIACTGRIRVCKDGIFNCGMFGTSSNDLNIPFSARNTYQTNSDGNIESVRSILLDFIEGGYKLYFHPNFITDTDAKNAFARALSTWRCATRVFFDIDTGVSPDSGERVCLIEYDNLPYGVGSTLRGRTVFILLNCSGNGIDAPIEYSYLEGYRIKFNQNIDWHKTLDMPNNLNWDDLETGTLQADLESTALHELGHAHLLNHTCNNANVMISPGPHDFRRNLTPNDEDGGSYISTLSYNYLFSDCPDLGMSLLPLSECVITPVIEIKGELVPVTIYPNPTQARVKINIDSEFQLNGTIEIFDNKGGNVMSFFSDSNTMQIDFEKLASGVYYLVYKGNNGNNSFLGEVSKH